MIGLAAVAAALAWLYGPVVLGLARQWQSDATYSHGWVIIPISVALAWSRRSDLRALPLRPHAAGLALLGAGLGLYAAGTVGAELFLTRVSLPIVLAGIVVYACGPAHGRVLAFPLAFLLFMIPLPAIVYDRIALSLQLAASRLAEEMLRASDVAVLRDGNVLRLATVTLEVDRACSGIRSLITLLALTALIARTGEPRWSRRAIVTLSAVPVAIALNGVRIAVTALAALRFGPQAASGLAHEATGVAVFTASLGCLAALHAAMRRWPPAPAWEAA